MSLQSLMSLQASANFNQHAKISAYTKARTIRRLTPVLIMNDRNVEIHPEDLQVTIDEIIRDFPRTVAQRLDKALLNIAALSDFVGARIKIDTTSYPLFYPETRDYAQIEMQFIMEQLVRNGVVATHENSVGFPKDYWLTARGWDQVADLERAIPNSTQGFIAMWFDNSISAEPFWNAITDAGFTPQRIDRKEHVNQISDEIIAEIRRSKFVVCDFTGQRGGVYFEAGFAMGLGLPVIWTCRSDFIKELHFDTRQYNHIQWETADELYTKLLHRIRAVIT